MNTHCIILARGSSKGIPNKNIIDFCGKPLLAWTIEQCKKSKYISDIWVSSNSEEILDVARKFRARVIIRLDELSDDLSTSESGWLHALEYIESICGKIELVVAPQVTSPLREAKDFDEAILLFKESNYDSMFTCNVIKNLFLWKKGINGLMQGKYYSHINRPKRRQDASNEYLENGSFYIFKPNVLRENNSRHGCNIGCFEMEAWKMFEIDTYEDLRICAAIMNEFILNK